MSRKSLLTEGYKICSRQFFAATPSTSLLGQLHREERENREGQWPPLCSPHFALRLQRGYQTGKDSNKTNSLSIQEAQEILKVSPVKISGYMHYEFFSPGF